VILNVERVVLFSGSCSFTEGTGRFRGATGSGVFVGHKLLLGRNHESRPPSRSQAAFPILAPVVRLGGCVAGYVVWQLAELNG